MFLRCRQPASQCLQERLPVDGFDDVIVHPGGEARIEVRLHRVRGHCNDRQVVQRRVFAYRPCSGETIHLGHLHVHQDSGVLSTGGPNHLQRLAAIVRDVELDPKPPQDLTRHHLVGLVVLSQQHLNVELPFERCVERPTGRMHARTLRFHDRVEQRRGGNWLGKKHVHAERGAARLLFLPCIGADEHDRQRAGLLACPNPLSGLESIHARQHPVEHHEAERIASSSAIATFQQRKSLLGSGHRHRPNRPAPAKCLEQLAARLGVFHDEDRPLGDAGGGDTTGGLGLGLDGESRGEDERCAFARRAFHGQVAAHQAGQPPADHEAEPRASVLSRR